MTPQEPQLKRAAVFVDGQNLFYAVRDAFGYIYPNFDILKLAQAICAKQGWQLVQTAFYTGVPSALDIAFWHQFCVAKLGVTGHQGIKVFSRPLRYRNKVIMLPDGTASAAMVGQEKGVDVPVSPTATNRRGVNKTDWMSFDRALYDACLDKNDYRHK